MAIWNINRVPKHRYWLVVQNMHGLFVHSVGNVIIPTDFHISQTNQDNMQHCMAIWRIYNKGTRKKMERHI